MEDTIVAISTALGVGAISIIRLSGKDAIEIVNNCFKGKDLTKVNSHTINYGFTKNNNEIVDEVLVSVMRAPKTFTTEDIVSIAETVAKFIKGGEGASLETSASSEESKPAEEEATADTEEDFTTEEPEEGDEAENESTESKEDFEI